MLAITRGIGAPHPSNGIQRGIIIVHPSQLHHHRGVSPVAIDPPPDALLLDGPTRAMLRQRRWRTPARDRCRLWLALAVAALLHGLFMLVIWHEMRPDASALASMAQAPEQAMQVRFIAHATPAAASPPPLPSVPSPVRARPRPKPVEPPARDALSVQLPTPTPAPAPLYDRDGQPRLPAVAASTAVPDYVQPLPQGDARIMRHSTPLPYQATRFDNDWGHGGNAVDHALQKLVDKTTVKKTIRLPRGVRIHCAISFAMLAGGCGGDPPPPPSAKDGDERLSMAPARPLAVDPQAAKPPTLAACIAMYRAGKPLAWGCPIDTPNRAIDDEQSHRAAGAAGRP